MKIDAIHRGIVLDHIKAGRAMDIYRYLHLDELQCPVAIIKNARSEAMGLKDIIKIDDEIDIDLDVVGFVDPGTTVNVIKDGVVVESSTDVKEDIPCISGVRFSSLAMYQKLAVENDKIFGRILNITQLLKKYELSPDKIEFGKDLALTLYFGNLKGALGSNDDLEDKIGRLHDIYSDLESLSGTLHMENYTLDSKFISFEKADSTE